MSRIAVPDGYTNWNTYTEAMLAGIADIDARRAVKRDIKLGMVAAVERYASGDTQSPSYREYHIYEPTSSKHPWKSPTTDSFYN